MKIIFTRHGKDDDRYRGGWSDIGLTLEGVKQAKKLGIYLSENMSVCDISYIVSSDLPRAMATADLVAEKLQVSVLKEPMLREINNGDLAGMLNEEALTKYPGLFFSSLEMDEPYPNGESPRAFYVRVKAWFAEFIDENRKHDRNILVVTHGGVINIIYHIVKGIEWSNRKPSLKVSNCSMHVLDIDTMEFEEV